MKIFLIGFMGSGKSLIGRLLAEKLSLDFIDLDQAIEEKYGGSIASFFSERGEKQFRDMEAAYLRETELLRNIVIATGGGTPCFYGNLDWMNDNGLTIFLSVPPQIIAQRLEREYVHRPLLKGKSEKEFAQFIEEKLESRMAFYESAQFVCHAHNNAEDIVCGIAEYFSRFIK